MSDQQTHPNKAPVRPGARPMRRAQALALAVALLPAVAAGAERSAVARAKSADATLTDSQSLLPSGHWTTFAHGNDILALQGQGDLLWAGARMGGLLRWDLPTGSYRQYLRPQNPLAGNTVRDIAIDAAGRKWLATDRGLTMFDDASTADMADDRWFSYTVENTAGGLPSPDVRALVWDGPNLWVGTWQVWDAAKGEWRGGGLARLETQGTADHSDDVWSVPMTFAATYRAELNGEERPGLVSDNINDLALAKDGDLWIAAAPHWLFTKGPNEEEPDKVWVRVHGGLSRLETTGTADRKDDKVLGFSCQDADVTITCNIAALVVDAQNRGWATIGGRGLMWFDAGATVIQDDEDHRIYLPERGSVVGDVAMSLALPDASQKQLEHSIWIGRSKGGLSVLDHRGTPRDQRDDRWNFQRAASFGTADGLKAPRVQAVEVLPGGAWLGLGPQGALGMGLQRLDLANLTVDAPLLTDRAPASNFISAIAVGAPDSRFAGQVLVGLGSRSQPGLGAGLAQLKLNDAGEDADDQWLRISTLGTDGDGKAPWTGLAGDNVQALLLQQDRLWVGSLETQWDGGLKAFRDGGLSVWDASAWTARTYDAAAPAAPGLKDGSVAALAAGCDGSIWVGTGNAFDNLGSGVHLLKPGASVHQKTQDSWSQFVFPNLTSDNTASIDVDCAQGLAWVASRHHVTRPDGLGGAGGALFGGGVARYDLAAKTWERADSRQGLESYADGTLYAEGLAVLAAPAGKAWVGGLGTRTLSQRKLLEDAPFWPAVLNLGRGAQWQNRLFARTGMVSALERDAKGRLWVATTRGGMAREGMDPDVWRSDLEPAGLFVFNGDAMDGELPTALPQMNESLVTNDIAAVAVGNDDEIWIGTEGWGLMRYRESGAPPTPTATFALPATATQLPPTAVDTPTFTPPTSPTPTLNGSATREPTPTPWTTGTAATPKPRKLWLPRLAQTRVRR